MNVQVLWANGVLRPLQPLHLMHEQVVIQIPDEEVISTGKSENIHDPAQQLLANIYQILGPYARQRPQASVEQDKAVYLEALQEKHSR